jgi:hypothetical protein
MSQATDILDMLKRGPVTAMDALENAGCFRLAARIADLRQQGHEILTETITTPTGKHIASYKLKGASDGRQTH